MQNETAAVRGEGLTRGFYTPTDGFYGIGVWGYTETANIGTAGGCLT